MSIWAGYFGDGDGGALKRLLGSKAQMHTSAGFGLGVHSTDGEPGRLVVDEAGGVTALVGVDEESGASASVNPVKKTLTLTRDPFGFHGAYTAQVGEVLWYASDARVLQRLPGISNRLNPAALHGYLCFSYVPTPVTLISGVAALPAAARLIVTSKGERSCENQASLARVSTAGVKRGRGNYGTAETAADSGRTKSRKRSARLGYYFPVVLIAASLLRYLWNSV